MPTDPRSRRRQFPTTRYRIRKVGRYWQVWHRHYNPIGNQPSVWTWDMTTSYWSMAMWLATGDRTYRREGFRLIPRIGCCS